MQISEVWLRELVDPPVSTNQLVEQLTMSGLEVASVSPAAADFSRVVIGMVLSVEPHPNADKLKICMVDVGNEEPLQIVCGANNVRSGLKVPVALIGAELPGGVKIKKSKLRDEFSFGMLCSEKELGLDEDAAGLMELSHDAPVGQNIREYLDLNDVIFEVDLTPNRADCLSVEGIAREVAVLNRMEWTMTKVDPVPVTLDEKLSVVVENSIACSRYLGRLIKNVNVHAETPVWMQEKLRRSGLRSLGPLVDVTNYVLLEMGQPLHAFDADKLQGTVTVRMGKRNEKLPLLNDQIIELDDDVLVIADDHQPLALAGVMGGSATAVSNTTKDVFLECAFFSPESIAGKARRFGLHTDSSHRFERGVDPTLQHRALERATRLIIDIAGGSVGPITEAIADSSLPERLPIVLRKQRIKSILGITLADEEVSDVLERLGMNVGTKPDGWKITPPGFRFDIAIEADLIEEIGRIYGYNNLPDHQLVMRAELGKAPEAVLPINKIKDILVTKAYREAITYSFVDEKIQQLISPDDQPILLKNPISADMSVMRSSLWCGLIKAALHNANRQQDRIRLFENGLRFFRENGEIVQIKALAGIALGNVFNEQWDEKNRPVDFFDMKADVEAVIALSGYQVHFEAAQHPALHPGQTAKILTEDNKLLGWLGMLHPTLEKQLGFEGNVFLFELDQDLLLKKKIPHFQSVTKFPSVRRDLALIVEEKITAEAIKKCIENCSIEVIQDIVLFDVYRGKGIEDGYKSIALAMFLQDHKQTLTDTKIDAIVTQVLESLKNQLSAKLRD
jgi:phenylalanyl-tRNA synthetase beta chain